MKRKDIGPVIIGLLLVIAGIGYAGNAVGIWSGFTVFFKGWWTLFIIIPCVIGILKNGFNVGNVVGVLVGVFFLISGRINIGSLWALSVPIVIIAIGLTMIFKNKSFNSKREIDTNTGESVYTPSYTAVFSGKEIKVNGGEIFKGATITSIFGGLELDLRNSAITEDIVIDTTTVFGGIDLKLPADVNVKNEMGTVFAGVEVKKNRTETPGAPTVTVTGSCIFGGVTIK